MNPVTKVELARITRRDALKVGASAATGLALGALVAEGARAEAKLSKSVAQYVDDSKMAGKDCDDCTQFLAGRTASELGRCRIVEGEINPKGHCIAFSAKP